MVLMSFSANTSRKIQKNQQKFRNQGKYGSSARRGRKETVIKEKIWQHEICTEAFKYVIKMVYYKETSDKKRAAAFCGTQIQKMRK